VTGSGSASGPPIVGAVLGGPAGVQSHAGSLPSP
jgi:hypothetical protein